MNRRIGILTRSCLAHALVLCVALFSTQARAFFDQPWVTPASPITGDLVSVSIHGGECDALFSEPGYPQITQQGNAIRMLRFGQHWPEGSGDLLCSYPIGTATYPVGTYPSGNYTLTVDLAYVDFFGMPSILTIGVVPFTVAGPSVAATPAPTLSPACLLVLTLALGLSAWIWNARQTGSS